MDKELLTKEQRIKYALLTEMAHYGGKETIEFCRAAYDFIMESEPKETVSQLNADGIYYVYADKTTELFDYFAPAKSDCIGIGVVWGNKRLIVALHDAANGKDVTLTCKKDETEASEYYTENHAEAIADWAGEENTEHLKSIGLSKEINLGDGWYIPALGELLFIFVNVKDINAALEKAGGQPLDIEDRPWYWSSTESSQTHAWTLYFNAGLINYGAKATHSGRVRPVSAFI